MTQVARDLYGQHMRFSKRVKRLSPSYDFMSDLETESDREQLLHIIIDTASRLLDADRTTLFLVDRHRRQLWSKIAQGLTSYEIRMGLEEGVAGHVASTGETLNVPDASEDSRFNPSIDRQTGYRTMTLLCMALRDPHGNVVGVIEVMNKRHGVFTEEDEQILGDLCSQAAILVNALEFYET